jgi:hypothetical protein
MLMNFSKITSLVSLYTSLLESFSEEQSTRSANPLTEVLSNTKLCMIQSKYQDNKMLIRRVSSHYSAYHECSNRFVASPAARVTKVLEYKK